jgi:hypothetical protein
MKPIIVVVAICLAPVLAFGQQTYTNEDLAKFQVPGAYTNEDLKRLAPLAQQKEPAVRLPEYQPAPMRSASLQARYDGLKETYMILQAEIALELQRVDFSESAFAGNTLDAKARLGYKTVAFQRIEEIALRADLMKVRIEALEEHARRQGVALDRR